MVHSSSLLFYLRKILSSLQLNPTSIPLPLLTLLFAEGGYWDGGRSK